MEKLGAGAARGWGNELDFALLSSFPAPSAPRHLLGQARSL